MRNHLLVIVALVVVALGAPACKDEPGSAAANKGPRPDAQAVIRIPPPPDAAPVPSWERRDLAQVLDASGKAPLSGSLELPTTATIEFRTEGRPPAPVAHVTALGVSFTLATPADRPSFETARRAVGDGKMRQDDKEKDGYTLVYSDADGIKNTVEIARGRFLCEGHDLNQATAGVVVRACGSLTP